ncbi:hypothetical protein F0U60_48650 [Archangium minus]|uniref:Lipoprotein n=1 Tax=Archangium minus TaxID=83450 RepID=A0ABY9X6V6_9BACT|nr:hypothetical protein F0U60_48650 [Archangium minus]
MRAKCIGGVLLMVGLLSAGCGGTEVDVGAQSDLATREDALPSCQNEDYELVFYSEPELINEVGRWVCICGWDRINTYGRTSAYSDYRYINECF